MMTPPRYAAIAIGALLVMIGGLLLLGRVSDAFERAQEPEQAASGACAYLSAETAQSAAYDRCVEKERALPALRARELIFPAALGAVGVVSLLVGLLLRPSEARHRAQEGPPAHPEG